MLCVYALRASDQRTESEPESKAEAVDSLRAYASCPNHTPERVESVISVQKEHNIKDRKQWSTMGTYDNMFGETIKALLTQ